MGRHYEHLSLSERCRLMGMLEQGLPKTEIARRLGRHRSTIHRELKNNTTADGYRPDGASRLAWARKLRGSRIERSTRLRDQIEAGLAMGWSPEQIVGRMELEGMDHKTSVESIYRHVYSPEGRRTGLPRQLAQCKVTRGRRRQNGRRAPSIPNRVSVHERPAKAQLRAEFGHWEGDLVHFSRQRDILLTLQERVTRLTLARRLLSKDAKLTASAIVAELGALPTKARRTITHDNGGEFAAHESVTAKTGMQAYFCDPHSPWQRGGIENANGLIRRDLPRKTSLSAYTDDDIDAVIWNLNSTPRKCLGYKTPIEAFAKKLGVELEM